MRNFVMKKYPNTKLQWQINKIILNKIETAGKFEHFSVSQYLFKLTELVVTMYGQIKWSHKIKFKYYINSLHPELFSQFRQN